MKNKSFGLVVPLREEAMPLLKKLMVLSEEKFGERAVIIGSIDGHKISLIISGCGKIKAASATQLLIDKYPSDLYLNFGTAGAISKGLQIGDIVVATEVIEHDVKEKFPEFVPPPVHPADKVIIKKIRGSNSNLKFGPIISGDEDVVTGNRKNMLFKKHRCLTVDWESAGFALTCQLNNVDFLVLRAVSDLAYEHTKLEYKRNQKQVVESITREILKILVYI
jgi:adenosylhomocysteine nucleosidase